MYLPLPHMSLQPGILTLLDKNKDVPLHANSWDLSLFLEDIEV